MYSGDDFHQPTRTDDTALDNTDAQSAESIVKSHGILDEHESMFRLDGRKPYALAAAGGPAPMPPQVRPQEERIGPPHL